MTKREYDSEEMSRRDRIGAHILHSRHDGRKITQNAREAFLDRFEREVDPQGMLEPQERLRRADHAKKAYCQRLAHRSVQARQAKAKKERL